jgi:hypothetical protein
MGGVRFCGAEVKRARLLRPGLILAALSTLAALCPAQTLTVTSPVEGGFLGQSNELKFTVVDANVEVTVSVDVVGPAGTSTISERFTPNADNKIDGQIPLNFSPSSPEGAYTLEVSAKRNDNNFEFGSASIAVNVDVTKPKILAFNPINNAFVNGGLSGIVPIRVRVDELNFKDYRVQVNGQDIPNNTGTSLVDDGFVVDWDLNGVQQDGAQTVAIRIRDQALNETTKSVTVSVDRVKPTVAIVQPSEGQRFLIRTNVSIAVDITDAAINSVDVTGVDVVFRRLDGTYVGRAARFTFRPISSNTVRWTGRFRYRKNMKGDFKIVVSVLDRAGNPALDQEVVVRF